MSVTLFFSSASPGRDDYAVMFLTVNSADRTRWPRWTKGWASSGSHDNMPEESRDFPRLLPSKGKLCAELPCEAPQLGPLQRSHRCSQTLKVPRNNPEGACDHLPGTLKLFLHSFYPPPIPYSCLPISQPGWILSLTVAADPRLQSGPFSLIYQEQKGKGMSFSLLLSSMNHEKENPHKTIIPLLSLPARADFSGQVSLCISW